MILRPSFVHFWTNRAKDGFWFQPEVFGASQDQAKNEGLSQRGRERLMFLESQSWRHPVQITFGKKGGGRCDVIFPGKAADSRLVVGFNPCSTICKPGKGETMGKNGKQFTKIGIEIPQFQHDPCWTHWMEKGHLPQVSSVLHGCLCQCTYLGAVKYIHWKMDHSHRFPKWMSIIHHHKRFNSSFVINTSFKCREDSKTNGACSHILYIEPTKQNRKVDLNPFK